MAAGFKEALNEVLEPLLNASSTVCVSFGGLFCGAKGTTSGAYCAFPQRPSRPDLNRRLLPLPASQRPTRCLCLDGDELQHAADGPQYDPTEPAPHPPYEAHHPALARSYGSEGG